MALPGQAFKLRPEMRRALMQRQQQGDMCIAGNGRGSV